jgi:uncharacterized membrane protein YphA (DoxX/SURF4 family)
MKYALWIIQALLAALFLFAGGMKLFLPLEQLRSMGPPDQIQFPGLFIRFIGLVEFLGGLGLILPGLLGIRPGLTPLAAAGLVIVMIGATLVTLANGETAAASFPLLVGLLSAFVAYGRWRIVPFSAAQNSRQPAAGRT